MAGGTVSAAGLLAAAGRRMIVVGSALFPDASPDYGQDVNAA